MTTVMAITMHEKIVEAQRRSGSCVCVGLDPDPSEMPVDDVFEFNRAIIDVDSRTLVAAYKPQLRVL